MLKQANRLTRRIFGAAVTCAIALCLTSGCDQIKDLTEKAAKQAKSKKKKS